MVGSRRPHYGGCFDTELCLRNWSKMVAGRGFGTMHVLYELCLFVSVSLYLSGSVFRPPPSTSSLPSIGFSVLSLSVPRGLRRFVFPEDPVSSPLFASGFQSACFSASLCARPSGRLTLRMAE